LRGIANAKRRREWIFQKTCIIPRNTPGSIVFAELPEEGADVEKGETLGSLESSKTVAEVYAPVSGQVLRPNRDLEEDPSLINDDPYGNGWLVTMDLDDPDELEGLLNSVEYENFLEKREPKKEAKG
jgi:glycine cleavage system H protein